MRQGQKTKAARQLRRRMTEAERLLRHVLRNRVLLGCKFRRQHPIGPYIVDFACLDHRLVVEADDCQHLRAPSDTVRDDYLRRQGFRVLRFWNNALMANPEGVCDAIAQCLLRVRTPPDPFPPAGEGANRRPK